MKRYKVVGSSNPTFMDIDMAFPLMDISIGKECEVFGHQFTITQTGKVLILSSKDWVLTLQEIEQEEVEEWDDVITDYRDLRINHELDLFFEPKELRINKTERIEKHGLTFKAVYEFMQNEWKFISHLTDVANPFDYDEEFDLLILNDEWNITGDKGLLENGSFSRYAADGRCI